MRQVQLAGEAGPLEALLDLPPGPPLAAALLCHPHPPSGGTMHTHAVFRAMRALRDNGCAVLRFNFRGVGRSAGSWDEGRGELADAHTAFAWLREQSPGLRWIAGGFSFGSWVGMTVGAQAGAHALLGLGVPYHGYDFSPVERSPLPKAFVLGDRDEFTPVATLQEALLGMAAPKRLWVVERASHLFTQQLGSYEATVAEAGRWLLEQTPVDLAAPPQDPSRARASFTDSEDR